MACQGIFIPMYKKSKQTSVNPYFGSKDSNLSSLGINTKDEFIVTEIMVEDKSVCTSCKKERCNEKST